MFEWEERSFPVHGWWRVDPWLLALLLALLGCGLVTLYSAGGGMKMPNAQLLRIVLGFAMLLTLSATPTLILRRLIPLVYLGNLALLVVVLVVGIRAGGAQRWIDFGPLRIQPSEFAKITVPLFVAMVLTKRPRPPDFREILSALLLTAVPVVLIGKEPDLGTSLLVGVSGLCVIFLAGLSWWFIAAGAFLVSVGVPLFWFFGIKAYQKERVLTLFNPESDPWGAGYHIIQSKIAIGSGGIGGKGFMLGTQSRLDFLPESTTDFIFSVFAEERGLIGVSILLCLYALLILRGLYLATQLRNRFAALVCSSVFFILFINVFVNIGMVSGFLPVVGLPLLFVSYGGSAMLTFLATMGIVFNFVRQYRDGESEEF